MQTLSAYNYQSVPGDDDLEELLLTVPPPLPLKWQWTVPDLLSADMPRPTHADSVACIVSFQHTPKTAINSSTSMANSAQPVAEKSSIGENEQFQDKQVECLAMKQFAKLPYDRTNVSLLVDRFVSLHSASDIPSVVVSIIFGFYYEEENELLQVSCRLRYSLQHSEKLQRFNGEQLMRAVERDEEAVDARSLCQKLVQFRYIERVAYRSSFSSFFSEMDDAKKVEIDSVDTFYESDKYIYRFVANRIEQYLHSTPLKA